MTTTNPTRYRVSADGFIANVSSLDEVREFVAQIDGRYGRARRVYIAKIRGCVVVAEKVLRENWVNL